MHKYAEIPPIYQNKRWCFLKMIYIYIYIISVPIYIYIYIHCKIVVCVTQQRSVTCNMPFSASKMVRLEEFSLCLEIAVGGAYLQMSRPFWELFLSQATDISWYTSWYITKWMEHPIDMNDLQFLVS